MRLVNFCRRTKGTIPVIPGNAGFQSFSGKSGQGVARRQWLVIFKSDKRTGFPLKLPEGKPISAHLLRYESWI